MRLTACLLLVVALPSCHGLMWHSTSNGEIPNTAVTYFPPKTTSPLHFCQVYDTSADRTFTGIIADDSTVCEYVDTSNEQVLTLGDGDDMGWKWAYYGDIPENAVACDDMLLGGQENCYLGVSLYSDGICRESIGKIDVGDGMMHFSIDQEAYMCPFYMYLTVKQAGSAKVVNLTDNEVYQVGGEKEI